MCDLFHMVLLHVKCCSLCSCIFYSSFFLRQVLLFLFFALSVCSFSTFRAQWCCRRCCCWCTCFNESGRPRSKYTREMNERTWIKKSVRGGKRKFLRIGTLCFSFILLFSLFVLVLLCPFSKQQTMNTFRYLMLHASHHFHWKHRHKKCVQYDHRMVR